MPLPIALFGGTFDPPHCGHLKIALAVLDARLAAQVWFMPAQTPPHKHTGTAFAHRFAMTELLVQNHSGLALCDIDARVAGRNYTIDSLRRLRAQYPDQKFRLVIGADMALSFGTWREAGAVLRLAPPLVAARPGYEFPAGFGEDEPAELTPDERRLLADGVFTAALDDAASTAIRANIARGDYRSVPAAVADYIRAQGLYSIHN
ncbi:putative nicotinate-nucleotide adenylyltransferase [Planctomycetales bacterium]|nr:putative nicotinate-nucleotide adenylyltransferase [Planctomycetales bacterium]GHS97528.1 putative nicotinate-nucleotide adenylyltransferase [Planctomycetales bacterium]GHT07081.1 putative nicotinate-nucleotide adenylyltransferase [Planctomycetales bacterium]